MYVPVPICRGSPPPPHPPHLSQHKLQCLQPGSQPHCNAPPGIMSIFMGGNLSKKTLPHSPLWQACSQAWLLQPGLQFQCLCRRSAEVARCGPWRPPAGLPSRLPSLNVGNDFLSLESNVSLGMNFKLSSKHLWHCWQKSCWQPLCIQQGLC